MEITEVKIKIVPRGNASKLMGFATITFDNAFVVKDVRIIQGQKGPIVAMPAKKLTFRCFKCGFKNTLKSKFCAECGRRVHANFSRRNPTTGRPILQVDIAHPINPETRKMLEEKVIAAYQQEFEKSQQAMAQAQAKSIEQVQAALRTQLGGADDEFDSEDFEEPGAPAAPPAAGSEPAPAPSPAPEPPPSPPAAPPGPA